MEGQFEDLQDAGYNGSSVSLQWDGYTCLQVNYGYWTRGDLVDYCVSIEVEDVLFLSCSFDWVYVRLLIGIGEMY